MSYQIRKDILFKLLDAYINNGSLVTGKGLETLINNAETLADFIVYGKDPRIEAVKQATKSQNPTVVSLLDQLMTVVQIDDPK